MRINIDETIPKKLTIINKLKKQDSASGVDVWYKHTINSCCWAKREHAEQSGTQTNVGASINIIIPDSFNKDYLPYHEWKDKQDKENYFTVSENDYVVLGTVNEDITANNIVNVMKSYEPNCCKVRIFDDRRISADMNGLLQKYASHLYIEGV